MFQVRIHGRGGQGVVTAAELLSVAAFDEGHHAQAFPSFGSERTGAPVVAFCRIGDEPIRVREPVVNPNAVVVQDPTLLHHVDVFAGLQHGGYVLVNSERTSVELGLTDLTEDSDARVITVGATEIAMRHLGRNVPNIVLLGGFAALTRIVTLASVTHAVNEKFAGKVAAGNIAAATEAHKHVHEAMKEPADA